MGRESIIRMVLFLKSDRARRAAFDSPTALPMQGRTTAAKAGSHGLPSRSTQPALRCPPEKSRSLRQPTASFEEAFENRRRSIDGCIHKREGRAASSRSASEKRTLSLNGRRLAICTEKQEKGKNKNFEIVFGSGSNLQLTRCLASRSISRNNMSKD